MTITQKITFLTNQTFYSNLYDCMVTVDEHDNVVETETDEFLDFLRNETVVSDLYNDWRSFNGKK